MSEDQLTPETSGTELVQAITLDAGGTLIHPFPSPGAVYARILESHQPAPPAEELDRCFAQVFHQAQTSPALDGNSYDLNYWRWIVDRTLEPWVNNRKIREDVFAKAYEEFGHARAWRLSDGILPFLNRCRENGLRLAVFSNNDARLRQVLDEFELTPYFESVFVSNELGFDKPDPRAFQIVAAALNLPPGHILHIGDSLRADYDGAIAAGWQALLLAKTAGRPGVHSTPSWQEAADAIFQSSGPQR